MNMIIAVVYESYSSINMKTEISAGITLRRVRKII